MSEVSQQNPTKIKIIAVVGTNASGKSSLGIALAKRFGGEIISADSRQVYRGFDLCCGKVTDDERAEVPHHMLDMRDLYKGETFSVADFQREAYRLIPEIIAREKIPFIVGGTGLYVDSVTKGYDLREEDPGDIIWRERLSGESVDTLLSMLPEETRQLLLSNPSDSKNKRRIIRLIEKTKTRQNTPTAKSAEPRFTALTIGVTWEREILRRRIDERLRARLDAGMIAEVSDYLKSGGDPKPLHDLGLEYRFILRYLLGEFAGEDAFRTGLATAINQFAKKQMTWFKRDKDIRWLDMNEDFFGEACALTTEFLGAR